MCVIITSEIYVHDWEWTIANFNFYRKRNSQVAGETVRGDLLRSSKLSTRTTYNVCKSHQTYCVVIVMEHCLPDGGICAIYFICARISSTSNWRIAECWFALLICTTCTIIRQHRTFLQMHTNYIAWCRVEIYSWSTIVNTTFNQYPD